MGTNGKYAIRIFVYIIRMYLNIRIEKSSMFSLRKTNNLHIRKQRRISADQRLCFHFMDSIIPILCKSEVFLRGCSLVCVGSGKTPDCLFSRFRKSTKKQHKSFFFFFFLIQLASSKNKTTINWSTDHVSIYNPCFRTNK